jgi:translocation protein SEC66
MISISDIDWVGLSVPFAYIVVLAGSLMTFSSIYRQRKAGQSICSLNHSLNSNKLTAKAATLAPWFPPHLQRNIYLSLLHLEPEAGNEKAPKVPDSVIRAALLRRAVEDIHRIIQVRSAKQACSTLLARGSVGDDLWQRFLRAEKEMEEELRDVVLEVSMLFRVVAKSLNGAWLTEVLGKCPRTKLGTKHLPIRK